MLESQVKQQVKSFKITFKYEQCRITEQHRDYDLIETAQSNAQIFCTEQSALVPLIPRLRSL